MQGASTRIVRLLMAAASLSIGTVALHGQQPPTPPKSGGLTTLRGCVTNPQGKKSFTLAESEFGTTYALKGLNVRDYLGKSVEITGAPSKLRIVGGLYPNPNVAAQAGAYDPVKAAMAAQTPSGTANPPVEFQVKSVRIVEGDCAK